MCNREFPGSKVSLHIRRYPYRDDAVHYSAIMWRRTKLGVIVVYIFALLEIGHWVVMITGISATLTHVSETLLTACLLYYSVIHPEHVPFEGLRMVWSPRNGSRSCSILPLQYVKLVFPSTFHTPPTSPLISQKPFRPAFFASRLFLDITIPLGSTYSQKLINSLSVRSYHPARHCCRTGSSAGSRRSVCISVME